MAKPNHLLKRGSQYYVRVRIPTALQEHYHPKKEIVHSLRTSDYADACLKVRSAALDILTKFEELKKTKKSKLTGITPDEIKRITDLWFSHLLEEDEEVRLEGLTDRQFDRKVETNEIVSELLRRQLARGRWQDESHLFEVDDFLESHGYFIDKNSPEYKTVAVEFLKAFSRSSAVVSQRNKGEIVETPKVTPMKPSGATSGIPLLSELIKRFLDKADQNAPMYKKYSAVLPLFLELVGDRAVDQLKQIDIENYCQTICQLPPRWYELLRQRKISARELSGIDHEKTISQSTYENSYIGALRPFITEAKRVFGDQGFPRHLTTDGIGYTGNSKAGTNKQRPLTDKEIKALFECKYMATARQSTDTEHEFWFPLVGLYTGARVNEVCQLNPQTDIRDIEGIWIFDFNDDSETDSRVKKSLKNQSVSKRTIPIHQKLIDLGFLKYVEAIQKSGAKMLFPQWSPSVGKASAGAREAFGELLIKLGLRDDTPSRKITGYHVFRHTMENRALNLEVDNIRLIVGHAGNRTTIERGYEGDMQIAVKKKILDRIWFDLDL